MHKNLPGAVCLLLAAFFLSLSGSALAQPAAESASDSPRGARYYLGDQDELLMKVNIWGYVRKPGQYMVPPDTDLISLMSFAGGPIEGAKIKSIKLIRSNGTFQRLTSTGGHQGASLDRFNNGPAVDSPPDAKHAAAASSEVMKINVINGSQNNAK